MQSTAHERSAWLRVRLPLESGVECGTDWELPMAVTIVVPIIGPLDDPDGFSEQALPVAAALAARSQGQVTLVSVMSPEDGFSAGQDGDIDLGGSAAHVIDERREYLSALGAAFSPARVEAVVRSGDAVTEILDVTRQSDGLVVVMASKGRTGIRRMVLGSVAYEVVQRARCPVIIVPARDAEPAVTSPDLSRVLVPLDLTPESERAVDVTLQLLGSDALDVLLLHVIAPVTQRASRHATRYYAHAREQAIQSLSGVSQRLESAGHRVSVSVRQGATAAQIAAVADEIGAGLIAMASYGRSGFSRVIYGSVSEDLARIGTRPILVVPAQT
jgi:nucleotide-binding universal stress UspA family protein